MTFSVNRRFDVLFGSIHFTDHAEFHSLQGVEIKIGEKFRPPKKVKYEKILFLNLSFPLFFLYLSYLIQAYLLCTIGGFVFNRTFLNRSPGVSFYYQ